MFVDDLDKLLVKFAVAVKLFGVNWHANGSLTEMDLSARFACGYARAVGRVEGAAPTGLVTFSKPYPALTRWAQ